MLNDFKDLPKLNSSSSHLTNFEEPIFKAFSMIKLNCTTKLLETKDDEYIYNELDNFLSSLCDLLTQTSEELTKTYFSHNNE
jgi:hypothetical protein